MTPPLPKSQQILAIDDDPEIQSLLRHFLDESGLEYELTACLDALQAMPMLGARRYSVVFLDHRLGSITGLDLLRQIVAAGDHPPVVMLTGHGDESLAAAAIRAGASDYLPKRALSSAAIVRSIARVAETASLEALVAEQRVNLEQANAVLVRKNREMQSFYHTVSHELKTPLTSALEYVSLVLEGHGGPTTEEQQDYLGVAIESCQQMVHYINDLLDVTRLETGKMSINRAPSDLAAFVVRTVESLMPAAAERGLVMAVETASDLPPAFVDERRIAQVIRNLLSNALKFTSEDGRILVTVAASKEQNMLTVAVADTGRGISEQDRDMVFERLTQVHDDDYATHGGLGLGLSICRDLVRLHGGRIWVESELGRGSTYSFTVPVHDPAAAHAVVT